MRSMVSRTGILMLSLLLAACAGKQPPPPPPPAVVPARTLQVEVLADASTNPDARGRPAPIVVRVYLLRSPVSFQAADFFALFDKDEATLGADLIAKEELQLRPGESARFNRELKPDARDIAVFAAFRDLERSSWRALATLPAPPAPTTKPPEKPIPVPVQVNVGSREIRVSVR